MTGAGHPNPALPDTLNRALRDVLTASGINPDTAFPGFLPLSGAPFGWVWVSPSGGDDTANIQAKVDAGGLIVLGPGTFNLKPVLITKTGTIILGSGKMNTFINFTPTANSTAFEFHNGSSLIRHCFIGEMTFLSSDTLFTKTMIKIVDGVECTVSNIQSDDTQWTGMGSIGVHVLGRENIKLLDLYIYADKNVVYDINPNYAPNSLDLARIERCTLVVSATLTNSAITFVDGSIVSRFSCDDVVGVRGGSVVYFDNTIAVNSSIGMQFRNVMHEQGVGTGYSFRFSSSNAELQQITLENCTPAIETNGVYLRKTKYVDIRNLFYAATSGVALNVDSTVLNLTIDTMFYQTGTTISGLSDVNGLVALNLASGSGQPGINLFSKDIDAGGGYRQTADGWYQDNIAASQTNVELTRSTGRFRAARAGSVTGLIATLTGARTAGTATFTVYKNTDLAGAAGSALALTAVIDGTNTSRKATTVAKDTLTYAAGDELYVLMTTDSSWAPTTSDVRCAIEIED
jgi:hypothetical protein